MVEEILNDLAKVNPEDCKYYLTRPNRFPGDCNYNKLGIKFTNSENEVWGVVIPITIEIMKELINNSEKDN